MNFNSFYPVVMTDKVAETSEFFQEYFSFSTIFKTDWYVSLKKENTDYELAILDKRHETVPATFRNDVQGLILNFEVDNVDEYYQLLINQHQLPLHLDIRDEAFGQRHFITSDPNGILIDVITIIPPDQSFQKSYQEQVWKED
ncbi:glyoxalase/bleomycin resistance/extradiol dioxygenase family protein [Ornithinibacillus salinisoli]|uniref:Glyoxalase/bleomycin resistance/extradiol dioxygenase family protein n=1 Tax=Ornithinibacillus salinisoli TaxID=1848459 RepID=A0ABW4VYK5_9BACI